MSAAHSGTTGRRSAAFSLTELIIVTVLISTIIAIILPSFSSIIAQSEETLASESLQSALRGGRAAALSAPADRDVAVVFFYEPGGRTTMGTYVSTGTILDESPVRNARPVRREVFVPVANGGPVRLPKDWMVRAFTPLNTMDDQWYGTSRYDAEDNNWVFPETGLYDPEDNDAGRTRQTFMVRFQAGTGKMHTTPMTAALIFDPAPLDADERADFGGALSRGQDWQYPGEVYDDDEKFVRRAMQDEDVLELIGDQSIDTILARPVASLALYNESEFARDLGVRVDRATGVVYQNPLEAPADDEGVPFVSNMVTTERMNQWVLGDTNLDGRVEDIGAESGADQGNDVPKARLYSIDTYSARLIELEVTP